jgi:hypothetical protein
VTSTPRSATDQTRTPFLAAFLRVATDRPLMPEPSGSGPKAYAPGMVFYGLGAFFIAAVLCIVAFVKIKQRDKKYEETGEL